MSAATKHDVEVFWQQQCRENRKNDFQASQEIFFLPRDFSFMGFVLRFHNLRLEKCDWR